MDLQRNKTDFEQALSTLKDKINEIEDDDLVDAINEVVTEYEEHLKGDIEKMKDYMDNIFDIFSTLEDEFESTQKQIKKIKEENE